MTRNPFILEERRANRELRAKARNTRRQEIRNLRTRRLNAGDKARNLKQKLKMAQFEARYEGKNTPVEQLAANYNAAKKNEEELGNKLERSKMEGIYNSVKEGNNRREKLVKNVIKQSGESKTDNFIKKLNANMNSYDQRFIDRLHKMPKNLALNIVDSSIQVYKNRLEKGLQNNRNRVSYGKQYAENQYSQRVNSTLGAYDPSLDPASQEAIALDSVIQSQLNEAKKVRNATLKLHNTNLKNISMREKNMRNMATQKIKFYETLRKNIQSSKFSTL